MSFRFHVHWLCPCVIERVTDMANKHYIPPYSCALTDTLKRTRASQIQHILSLHTAIVPEHIGPLTNLLIEIAGVWELFFVQLGLSGGVVYQIRQDNAQKPDFSKHCLMDGLQRWIQSKDNPATFEKISAVLNGKTVPNQPLGLLIEQFANENVQGIIMDVL